MPHSFDNLQAADANRIALTRGKYVDDDDVVGIAKRARKVVQQSLGARIGMRLENRPDAFPRKAGPRGGQCGTDFRWVVRIVVHERDSPEFALDLKSAFCSTEPGECRTRTLQIDANRVGYNQRRQCIQDVMCPWNLQMKITQATLLAPHLKITAAQPI